MRARLRIAVAFLAAMVGDPGPAQPVEGTATLTGTVEAIDGDSLDLTHGMGTATRVRLYGLDAPEGGQRCHDARGRSGRPLAGDRLGASRCGRVHPCSR
jgi:endonuclease YncB( thermonuclease family)